MFGRKSKENAESAATPTNVIQDEYTEIMKDGPPQDREGLDRLWRWIMHLDEWHFVTNLAKAEEAIASGRSPMPFIGVVDGSPMMFAFTSDARATEWGIGRAEADGNSEGFGVIGMPRSGALDFLSALPDEVVGVVFNMSASGESAFGLIDNLPVLVDHYHGGAGSPALFDRAVRAGTSGRHRDAMRAAAAFAARAPTWFVLVTKEAEQPVVTTVDGDRCVVLFTSEDRVQPGIEAAGVTSDVAMPQSLAPKATAMLLQSIQLGSNGDVKHAIINFGTQPMISSIDEIAAWVQQFASADET